MRRHVGIIVTLKLHSFQLSNSMRWTTGAPPSPPGAQGPLPIGGHSGDPGLTPYGVNFAQLNQEVRHIYSFAVIETAKRVSDSVLRDSGGMQRIVDSAASNITPSYNAPYAVGAGAHGDARVSSAQRLHDGLLALLTGTRRVLEDKAFVALARGIWDHIGSVAHMAIENLQNGAEDPVCHPFSQLFSICIHVGKFFLAWLYTRTNTFFACQLVLYYVVKPSHLITV